MSNRPPAQALRDQALERLREASADLAHAEAGLAALPLSALEVEIIVKLFILDENYASNHSASAISQAVAAWPDRALADWAAILEAIHRHPAWATYRLRRDLFAAAETLERATASRD